MSDLTFILDMQRAWWMDLFRWLFSFLDFVAYFIIEVLFRSIFNLANFELYGLYESIQDRIFVVLGIFMLFKVTISLITYLVSPEKITDKEQGASKLVVRIIMVLIMLIGLPTFFSLMTEAQNKILPVIPRVIIGTENSLSSEDVTGISRNMSLTMLQGFAHRKDECDGQEMEIQDVGELVANINAACISNGVDTGTYMYDYLPIISTLVGVIMCYVLFSLCISVAIRAFKLIILRSIAPIPIISYIDPKSSSKGDGTFSTWVKTFFSTWAELFIFIGIIYFVVYLIDFMISADMWRGFFDGLTSTNTAVRIFDGTFLIAFLIIGLLMFAKSAPKFIMDALGIKSKGNFMRMLGMGATALGMGGSAASAYRALNEHDAVNNENGKVNRLKNLGAALFSGAASGMDGGKALLTSDKPNLRTGIDAQSKYNAQNLNRIESGSTAMGRAVSLITGVVAGQTPADVMRKRNKSLETANKAFKDYKSTIESRFDGNEDYTFDYGGHKFNWLNFDKNFAAAQNGDEAASDWLMSHGFSTTIEVDEEYPVEERVQVGTESVWDDDSGEYVDVPKYETHTKTATRRVTKTTVDLNRVRAEYEKIHKTGYKSFTKDVVQGKASDSVVIGELVKLKDAIKGVVVSDYDEFGKLIEDAAPIDLTTVDFADYGTVKATLGDISGTQRDYVLRDEYKAAMADEKESKK